MAIQDDFSIATNGDIRYTGSGTNYTVIALHRWLGDLMDDAAASGNDILDITDATASERSTDNIITLKSPYNIDDIAAQHLYDGSIIQDNGNTIYDGLVVIANAGMRLEIIQNGQLISPNFWTTGLNADAANGISHRFMVKVRTGAADIDGRRLVGITREHSFTYSEFKINGTARGNNVMALTYASDLNNTTAIGTVAGWNSITNTEGYRSIDVDGNATPENYYSEWNKDVFTINQFYERLKWLSRRGTTEHSGVNTGNNFNIGNGTITAQAQSYTQGAKSAFITRVFFRLKKTGSPTGNITAKVYAHTGTFGSSGTPTGAALATSSNVDASKLTTSYAVTEFYFPTPFEAVAGTNYFVSVELSGGDGSNNVQVEGDTTGSSPGNRAENTGSWAAAAAEDLDYDIHTSPSLYEIPGERFRGITHQITVDTPTGTFQAVEPVSWSGGSGQMLAINSPTAATLMWIQLLTGVAPTDNQVITGGQSGATAMVNVTVTERTLSMPFHGASTGSAIIGAYGLGIEAADLTANDRLFDLTNTQRTPPNNVIFTVNGLISGEDRVLVTALGYEFEYDGESGGPFTNDETVTFGNGATAKLLVLTDNGSTGRMVVRLLTGSVPADNDSITGGSSGATAAINGAVSPSIDLEQLTLNGALSGAAVTAVVVNESIPTDTPATGTIRIQRADGTFTRHAYTSYTGSTFTIGSTDFSSNNAPNGGGVYVSYIDKLATSSGESFTSVFLATRNLFIRVRDGGGTPIKTFETTGVLGSAGGSSTAIRTSDT